MTLGFAAVLKIWKKAVQLLEEDDFRGALSSFESIPSTPIPGLASARILFNIGCIHTTLGDYQTAYKKLTETVEKDEHMAIGYFQRGCVLNKLSRISEAEEDFMKCRQLIRKDMIDYTQLGLWRQLYACEALYNAGIQASKQNLLTKAIDNLLQASKLVTKEKHACINEALQHADQNPQGIKALPLLELVATDIFRPPKDKSDVSVRDHDFLGRAKVVASKDTSDIKTGFQGRHLLTVDENEVKSRSAPSSPVLPRASSKSDDGSPSKGLLGKIKRAVSPNPTTRVPLKSDLPRPPPPSGPIPHPPGNTTRSRSASLPSVQSGLMSIMLMPVIHVSEPGEKQEAPQLPQRAKQVIDDEEVLPDAEAADAELSALSIESTSHDESGDIGAESRVSRLRPKTLYPPRKMSCPVVLEHPVSAQSSPRSLSPASLSTHSDESGLMSSDSGSDMDGAPRLPPRTSSRQVTRDTRQPATYSKNHPPAPPTGQPPPRPVSRKMVTVELTCNSTCKLQIEANSRLSLMVQRACEQFDLPPNSIQLWFQSNGEYTCIDSEDLMQKVWFREVKNGHMSLWCFGKQ